MPEAIYRQDEGAHYFTYPEGDIVVPKVPLDKLGRLPVDIVNLEGEFLGRDMVNIRVEADMKRLALQAGNRDGVAQDEWADRLLAVSGVLDPVFPRGGVGAGAKPPLPRIAVATLQREALSGNVPAMKRLPLLGTVDQSPFISGWSHLLSGYPKAGKTELLTRLMHEWAMAEESILFFTEEPQAVWWARLATLGSFDNLDVNMVFAMGSGREAIEATITAGSESVVIIDTTKLLMIRDENDNSAINLALTPLLATVRAQSRTLVWSHHTRKGGGDHGETAAGGHAYTGIVDVVLELDRDRHHDQRRLIRGWGRVVEVVDITYEMLEDHSLKYLGNPKALEAEEIKERVSAVLGLEWATTKKIREELEDPQPSQEAVRLALLALARDDVVERDPPLVDGAQKRGKTHRWRIPSSSVPTKESLVGTELEQGGQAEEVDAL